MAPRKPLYKMALVWVRRKVAKGVDPEEQVITVHQPPFPPPPASTGSKKMVENTAAMDSSKKMVENTAAMDSSKKMVENTAAMDSSKKMVENTAAMDSSKKFEDLADEDRKNYEELADEDSKKFKDSAPKDSKKFEDLANEDSKKLKETALMDSKKFEDLADEDSKNYEDLADEDSKKLKDFAPIDSKMFEDLAVEDSKKLKEPTPMDRKMFEDLAAMVTPTDSKKMENSDDMDSKKLKDPAPMDSTKFKDSKKVKNPAAMVSKRFKDLASMPAPTDSTQVKNPAAVANKFESPAATNSKRVKSPVVTNCKKEFKNPAATDPKYKVKNPVASNSKRKVKNPAATDCKEFKNPAATDRKYKVKNPVATDSKNKIRNPAASGSKSARLHLAAKNPTINVKTTKKAAAAAEVTTVTETRSAKIKVTTKVATKAAQKEYSDGPTAESATDRAGLPGDVEDETRRGGRRDSDGDPDHLMPDTEECLQQSKAMDAELFLGAGEPPTLTPTVTANTPRGDAVAEELADDAAPVLSPVDAAPAVHDHGDEVPPVLLPETAVLGTAEDVLPRDWSSATASVIISANEVLSGDAILVSTEVEVASVTSSKAFIANDTASPARKERSVNGILISPEHVAVQLGTEQEEDDALDFSPSRATVVRVSGGTQEEDSDDPDFSAARIVVFEDVALTSSSEYLDDSGLVTLASMAALALEAIKDADDDGNVATIKDAPDMETSFLQEAFIVENTDVMWPISAEAELYHGNIASESEKLAPSGEVAFQVHPAAGGTSTRKRKRTSTAKACSRSKAPKPSAGKTVRAITKAAGDSGGGTAGAIITKAARKAFIDTAEASIGKLVRRATTVGKTATVHKAACATADSEEGEEAAVDEVSLDKAVGMVAASRKRAPKREADDDHAEKAPRLATGVTPVDAPLDIKLWSVETSIRCRSSSTSSGKKANRRRRMTRSAVKSEKGVVKIEGAVEEVALKSEEVAMKSEEVAARREVAGQIVLVGGLASRVVRCSVCGCAVAKAELTRHAVAHSRPEQCVLCGKRFFTEDGLRKHEGEVHTAERFRCALCPKEVTTRARLARHVREQHGLKQHECDVCGKRFARATHLRQHYAVHTGATPHACRHCGDRFRFLHGRRMHELRAHRNPYWCVYCRATFANETALYEHVNEVCSRV